ncbi:MAG TPA: sulfotransferase [Rhizomicrobium sp.]
MPGGPGTQLADADLQDASRALREGRPAQAEDLLLVLLEREPDHVEALKLLAEAVNAQGRHEDAEALLAEAVRLAPDFAPARYRHAAVLLQLNRLDEAQAQIDELLKRAPRNPKFRTMKGRIQTLRGKPEQALACFEALVKDFPGRPNAWIQLGHANKLAGRSEQAIATYRRAIELFPELGVAYWSLANLGAVRFSDGDIAAMEAQAARADLPAGARVQFHYALGRAFEDRGAFERSFQHFRNGADLWRSTIEYDAASTLALTVAVKSLFTREFFAARASWGSLSRDPIFIVGMPRSGSTLVEQILSSHSAVEGTMELPDLPALAKRLELSESGVTYPDAVAELTAERAKALGEEYLARTRPLRHLDRPRFTDKMPKNFQHIPLIRLILPKAKIVDVRRHPLACCFSNYKQLFERGQNFSYDLAELGGYYRSYVEFMAHIDEVLPGTVHRVLYEELIENPEREIRRLLEHLQLPFEGSCLRFHETERQVLTASSEQVRRPLYSDATEHWRNYEPWLGPLKDALGPVLDVYPEVPCEEAGS